MGRHKEEGTSKEGAKCPREDSRVRPGHHLPPVVSLVHEGAKRFIQLLSGTASSEA